MPKGKTNKDQSFLKPYKKHHLWARLLLCFVFFSFQLNLLARYESPPILVDTLDCEPGFYQTIENNGTLVRYEYNGFELGFEVIAVFGFQVNATGFNVLDGFMYCIASGSQRLIRFDTDGNYTDLGVLEELSGNIYVGGFDTKGNYYVMQGGSRVVFKIDVTTQEVETLNISTNQTFQAADWAYVESADRFYGVGGDNLFSFDPNTNRVETFPLSGLANENGGFGGAFATVNGGLFVSNNQSGNIFFIDITSLSAIPLIGGPTSGINDGAACPCALPPFPAIIPSDDEFCASSGIPFPVLDNDLASLEEIDPSSFEVTFDPLFGEVEYDEDTGTVIYTSDDPTVEDFFVYEICLDYVLPVCAQAVVRIIPDVITEFTESICEGDTLNFEGEMYSEEGTYTSIHSALNGCDSIVHLNLKLRENQDFEFQEAICAGDEFEYNGEVFTEEGMYEFSFLAENDCDSLVTLALQVNDTYEFFIEGSICDGEAFEHDGVFFGEAGTYEIPYLSTEGCDSIVHVEVILKSSSSGTFEDQICEGDTYTLNGISYTESGSYVQDLQASNGCDSTLTFTLQVETNYNSFRIETICPGETFTLEDGSTYTEEGSYQVQFSASNSCDSLVNLNLIFRETFSTNLEESICEGETFVLDNENSFTDDGVYEIVYSAINSCDSIVTLDLQILEHKNNFVEAFICEGEAYQFADEVIVESGIYDRTFVASNGCDSLVTLDLTVGQHQSFTFAEQICEGEEYVFEGNLLNNSGTYEELLQAQNGCDSIVRLELEVLPKRFNNLEVSICEGESFTLGTVEYAEEGFYEQTFAASNGCDSLVSLNLSIAPNFTNQIMRSICEGESFDLYGDTYSQQGDYEIFIEGNEGCDSIIFLQVNVNQEQSTDFSRQVCEGENFEWNGQFYETAGEFEQILQTQFGCDSVVTLNLIVDPVFEEIRREEICDGEEVEIDNVFFSQDGLYELNLSTVSGCDSLIVLDLQVNQHELVQIQEEVCAGTSVEVAGQVYSSTGLYSHDLQTSKGCDSLVQLDLIVYPIYELAFEEEICEGEVFIFNGDEFSESGFYEFNLSSAQSCDSTVFLDLLVKEHINIDLEEVICIGSVYTLGTTEYAEAGIYQQIHTAQNGCDSIINLDLRVEEVFSTTLERAICNGESVEVAGESFNNTGVYELLIQASNGCDSLVTLDLQVWEHAFTELNASICEGESYEFGSENISSAGTYEQALNTINGCDSTVMLFLDVRETYETFLDPEICEGEVFVAAANVYSESGEYNEILTAANGCDSVLHISLQVHPLVSETIERFTCIEMEVGQLTEIFSTAFGCDSTVITNTFLLPLNDCDLIASVLGETLTCDRAFGNFEFDISVGTAPFTLTWQGPQSGSMVINVLGPYTLESIPPGNYNFLIVDANGNEVNLTADIDVHETPEASAAIALSFGEFDISCHGNEDGAAFAIASGGTEPYTYFWSTGDMGPEITGLGAGEYVVTLVDANQCESISIITLIQPPPLEMELTVSEIECFDLNSGFIELTANGGVLPYNYSINDQPFQPSNQFPSLSGGSYELVVSDANGCLAEEVVLLNTPIAVDVALGDDIEIDLGEGVNIQALVNIPIGEIDSIFWSGDLEASCDTCLQQIVFPIITSSYTIKVDDENGCSDFDEITINVDRDQTVYIPNAFSPNGDGINDVFMVFGNLEAPPMVNSFHVYDRWGNKMYEQLDFLPNNPDHSWDGNFRGQPQNPGVYVWYAIIEFFDGRKVLYEGDVTLMR